MHQQPVDKKAKLIAVKWKWKRTETTAANILRIGPRSYKKGRVWFDKKTHLPIKSIPLCEMTLAWHIFVPPVMLSSSDNVPQRRVISWVSQPNGRTYILCKSVIVYIFCMFHFIVNRNAIAVKTLLGNNMREGVSRLNNVFYDKCCCLYINKNANNNKENHAVIH